MKTTIISIIFIALSLFNNLNAQTVNACIGTDTLSSNYPFTTYWMDGRTDMLYLASEITASGGVPGYFMGISYYFNYADTIPLNGFNVKILNTSDTALTGFSEGWTVCYSETYKPLSTGWQTIYFTQPYGWNGNDNIIIEVCYNNSAWTKFSPVRSTLKPNKTFGKFTDLSQGDGCIDITTGALQARRPNICLIISPLTGVGNISSVPDKYSLSQNYPNPFNPITRINYSISRPGLVTLVIFDALGRQVSELVNEYKNAGNHIVEFNASCYSSGVYYYKMVSGDFSDTKKMIVIK